MVNIFSCACWPFVYLLWKNMYSDPLPIFQLSCLFFGIELYELFTYFGYYLFISHIICKYFLPFSWLSFHSVNDFFCCANLLSLIRPHLLIFAFVILPEEIDFKNCYNLCQGVFWLYFFFPQEFYSFSLTFHSVHFVYGMRKCWFYSFICSCPEKQYIFESQIDHYY